VKLDIKESAGMSSLLIEKPLSSFQCSTLHPLKAKATPDPSLRTEYSDAYGTAQSREEVR
jgi:hypothetical protein